MSARLVGLGTLFVTSLGTAQTRALPDSVNTSLLRDVSALSADSMAGRMVGTVGSDRAQRYLVSRLRALGLDSVGGGFQHSFQLPQRSATGGARGTNLVGEVRGTLYPERYFVISAHYDHLGVRQGKIFHGADDNASGTAAVLAAAAYFRLHPPLHSLLFVLFDAEEEGLLGAKAFVEAPPVALSTIRLDVNLDMVSHSERGELYVAGLRSAPALRKPLEDMASASSVHVLFGHDGPGPRSDDDWSEASDHAAFGRAHIPYVYFGVEDHKDYHQPTDDFASITTTFFKGAVATILDGVRRLDKLDL